MNLKQEETAAERKKFLAVAHSPKFAAKVDVPQSVGKGFVAADKRALVTALRSR